MFKYKKFIGQSFKHQVEHPKFILLNLVGHQMNRLSPVEIALTRKKFIIS